MNDKQKIVTFILALLCNFTFLANAQTTVSVPGALKLPECDKAFGEDSLETLRTMSVLQEDYRNKDYFYAYKWFTYLFTKAPCAFKNTYLYGQGILPVLINDTAYAKRRDHLIDTLMMVYPTRIKYFGEEGQVKGSWAYNMGKYRPDSLAKILSLYKYYSTHEKLDDVTYLRDYMKQAVNGYKKNLMSKEELFALYDLLSTASTDNMAKLGAADSVQYQNWNGTLILLDRYMAPYLKCADIDMIYQPKLKADPENKELIIKVIKLYKTAGSTCKDNANFVNLLEKSFTLEPNAVAAEELAYYFEKKKNNSKANFYFEKAAELTEDVKKKEQIYLDLANKNMNNLSVAKSYANKVLDLNPNNGYAIIIQGLALYANRCGDAFDKAMAACAAVDVFNRAKSVDPSVSAEANKQIAIYSKHFPNTQDAFFRGLKAGDSYTIGCLGVTSTIRLK